jgi:lipoyl(octanoyl) transferase
MQWTIESTPTPYPDALLAMQQRVAAIRADTADELVWLLEHPACFTAGTSAKTADLFNPQQFPVYDAGRGGQYTYHGPGQRVAYVLLDVQSRKIEIRDYVCRLEKWIITTLGEFGVIGFCRDGRIGVWVDTPGGEAKIAALGIRVSRGVAFHGISLNVNPDLSHFTGIIPCGIGDYGVTSLAALGRQLSMADVDSALKKNFLPIFY